MNRINCVDSTCPTFSHDHSFNAYDKCQFWNTKRSYCDKGIIPKVIEVKKGLLLKQQKYNEKIKAYI